MQCTIMYVDMSDYNDHFTVHIYVKTLSYTLAKGFYCWLQVLKCTEDPQTYLSYRTVGSPIEPSMPRCLRQILLLICLESVA